MDNNRRPGAALPGARGFTYIETIFSVMVLGLATVSSLQLYGGYLRGIRIQQEQMVAQALAADLMAEILDCNFEDPALAPGSFGMGAGESIRRDFNDVDDYDGWTESPPKNRDGNPLSSTAFSRYTRSVEVFNVNEADFVTVAADGATGAKAVRVTVTASGIERSVLTSHVAR